jgi:hypothetical protein
VTRSAGAAGFQPGGFQSRGVPATLGRQWDAWDRKSDRCRRRDELSRMAFLLLGGREAASRFLTQALPGLSGLPIMVGTASALGQLQVSRMIQRAAAARARTVPEKRP